MRFPKVTILFLLPCALALGCSRNMVGAKLADVDSYIQEYPDSALTVLESLDRADLVTPNQKAMFSLLYAMALDKNYIDTTDIQIIQPALSYFTRKDRQSMEANYYAGRICINGGDYSNALIHYNTALEKVAPDDYKYQGLIYYSIGNAYLFSFSFKEELTFHKKALEAFQALGDSHYIDLAAFGVANAYHNNRDFHAADSLYHGICASGDSLRPVALSSMVALADNYLKSGDFNDECVRSLIETALEHGRGLRLEEYYEYAYVLSRLGECNKAESILHSLAVYPDTYTSLWWRYKIELEKGNYKEAEELLEASIELQNLEVREKLTQSVFKSQSEYYRYAMLSTKQKQTILHQRFLLVSALFVLVLSAFVLIYKRRKRIFQDEKEKLLLALEESENMLQIISDDSRQLLEEEHESHREKVLELQKMYASLYQKQFSAIGRYYDASYLGNPERASQKMVRNVTSEINSILAEISTLSNDQHKFEERINKDADNIIAKIRSDYPKFTESDIRFICYIVVGFDATTISVLMNITGENARVKRYRIRHRLLNNSGPNAGLYRIWFE